MIANERRQATAEASCTAAIGRHLDRNGALVGSEFRFGSERLISLIEPQVLPPPAWIDDARIDDVSVGTSPLEAWDDGSDWEGVVPLRRSAIRLRSRLAYTFSRSIWWGRGKRRLACAGLVASCALTAACASAARSVPSETPNTALAANATTDQPSFRLPGSLPPLRAAGRSHLPTETENPGASGIPTPSDTNLASGEATRQPSDETSFDANPRDDRWPSILGQDRSSDRSLTQLVAFNSAPFPYDGLSPGGGAFLDVTRGDERGHRGRRGQILWEAQTFNDNHVLVHIPARFDPARPAVMVVFFHGYGATLSRDVAERQQVPAQISASGANAVLVAPQFAVDARDPSAGHFWEPGGFSRFLDETARQLARLQGNPAAARQFAHMPIVIVAYSGGFYPAAFCLKDLGSSHRVRGILMLDAAYGEFERYADWAAANRSSFLVSAYSHFTSRQNGALMAMMSARGVPVSQRLDDSVAHGGATFLAADTPHNDYVTKAWTDDPIQDILMRIPELRVREPQAIAAMDLTPTASIH